MLDDAVARLGVDAPGALAVVASAVGIYLAFLLMVRVLGQRVLSRLSTFDAVVVVMLGAVAGRAVLGDTPTLAAGVLGLGTLFALEAGFGRGSGDWASVLTPLSRTTRTCAYDRAGLGSSVRIRGVHDAADEVADLERRT